MSKKMRENEEAPTTVAAIPNDAILMEDGSNWVVLPQRVRIKMKDWQRWVEADANADFDTSYSYLAKFVQSWSFSHAGDPSDKASWGELDLSEYLQVNRAVSEYISGELQRKN